MFYGVLFLLILCNVVYGEMSCYYGQYLVDDLCVECIPGQYQDTKNSTSCKSCDADTFSVQTGSIYCQSCGSNTYATIGASECQPCGSQTSGTCCEGYVLTNGVCTPCVAGRYASNSGCQQCPDGQVSDEGSASCVECDANSIPFDSNSVSICVPCPDGFTKLNATTCAPCPEGSYEDSGICTPVSNTHLTLPKILLV